MERAPDLAPLPPRTGRAMELRSGSCSLPQEARAALRELQRQLDGWCRDRGWPTSLNGWVAEAAVRQVWASEGPG
jgi:hypothetical protein